MKNEQQKIEVQYRPASRWEVAVRRKFEPGVPAYRVTAAATASREAK